MSAPRNDAAGTDLLADVFNFVWERRRDVKCPHNEAACNQVTLAYRLLLADLLQFVELHVCPRLKGHKLIFKAMNSRQHWSLERIIRNHSH